MANYLVTGGAGFIGSHLTTRLVEMGHSVRVLDDFSTGKRQNLDSVAEEISLFEGDMRDAGVCRDACRDMDMIFHEAAIPSVPKSVDQPIPSHDANINGVFNLLMASKECGVRRIIYAASSSAYGDSKVSPKHEELIPDPLSPYAVQKHAGELYLRAFYECFGLESIALRYFNVFGPKQDPNSQYAAAIPAFVTSILNDEPPTVYGDGEQTRDFTYIENVIHGNILAAEAKETTGQRVNVACGGQISVNEVIAKINEILGKNVPTNHVPARKGDIKHSCADIGLARRILGFEPQVDFAEGLRRSIDYYASILTH